MKVIFLEDVANIARAGDIKEVSDGYGRNFLIPKKLAALVSPGMTTRFEAQFKSRVKKQSQTEAELVNIAQQIEDKEVILQAKVGANYRLYGSITSADIATKLETMTGIAIDKRKIELDEPIRELGSFDITIRLGKDILPKIKVTINEEERG